VRELPASFPHEHQELPDICNRDVRCHTIKTEMKMRRILAGSIVTLLLAVSALAASCDLSCAFAREYSDCHARESNPQASSDSGMDMDGMDMTGMPMPGMASGGGQSSTLGVSRKPAPHPFIGEMGPCERKSCDQSSSVSVKAVGLNAPRLRAIVAVIPAPLAHNDAMPARKARDDVASIPPPTQSCLPLNLRI
jgi:hypothetical protein